MDGCSATDQVSIVVDKVRDVYFPNAFSPNDDGINDLFFIGAGKSVSQITSLQIFSRWGELVFDGKNMSPNDPLPGWDGKFNGQKMDTGVFLWEAEIEFIDGELISFNGDLVLIE